MLREPVSDETVASVAPAVASDEVTVGKESLLRCSGSQLRSALLAATRWLEHQAAQVNALNVFPVPDGDTGTNMALTMRAAVDQLEHESADRHSVGELLRGVEHAALMGARGNSGVILSQILRGLARALRDKVDFDALELAEALRHAELMAYRAVIKPVEGTMLTVIREMAEAAQAAAHHKNDLRYVIGETLIAARAAVRRTPELLDLLRQAGVVDAGGQGLLVLFEEMLLHVIGGRASDVTPRSADAPTTVAVNLSALHHGPDDDYGYCTNFMIRGQEMPFETIRAYLAADARSVVIVGDERLIKVHLHTLDPGWALSYAVKFGDLTQVKIDNMDDQHAAFADAASRPAAPSTTNDAVAAQTTMAPIARLAVASGAGFEEILRSLGVDRVIAGGQTMNPSAADLLTAIEAVPQASVIVLPNNGNIMMAARQAAELATKEVVVIPTKTVPQGIAALLAFQMTADLATNAATMEAALAGVQTGEVTRAVRSVELDGVSIKSGDIIAVLDDRVIAAVGDVMSAVLHLLVAMGANAASLVTLYAGEAIEPAMVEAVQAAIASTYPALEIEVLDGGQPHYDLILTVE